MRRNKILIYLALSTVAFSACKKDFLTLYPEGNLNEGLFYKSTTDFQQAVNGAYGPLRDISNNAYWMDEMRADNAYFEYNSRDRGNAATENLVTFLDDASSVVTQNRYQADYTGVTRTNVVLDRLAAATFAISDSAKNAIIGEAKALRGHYFFDLVRTYGGVPLVLHEVTTAEQAYVARASAEQVYTQVISDLTDAMNLLTAPSFSAASTGRVNKGSVATELAAVYMQRKDYAKASPLLQSVAGMGYALMPSFRDVFDPNKKLASVNRELILDVQFQSGTTLQSSNFIYRFTPITTNTMNLLGVSFNNTIGGWEVPTDDLISNYDTATDTRFDASVGIVEGTLDASSNFIPSRVVSAKGYTAPAGVIAKRFAKKYYYPPYPNLNQNTDQNWPLYRYSDALLMLAEALNETGNSAGALPYLNQVRTRAFGAGKGQVTVTDQAGLRAAIAKERRLELAFENKRWQDLIRTDQAITVLNAYGVKQKQMFGYLLPQSYNVTASRLLYPIPLREIQLNSQLTQNPGY